MRRAVVGVCRTAREMTMANAGPIQEGQERHGPGNSTMGVFAGGCSSRVSSGCLRDWQLCWAGGRVAGGYGGWQAGRGWRNGCPLTP
ncbi:MAG: hypothetical protein ACKON9_29855, partial [Planctomycetaceae bacterium]